MYPARETLIDRQRRRVFKTQNAKGRGRVNIGYFMIIVIIIIIFGRSIKVINNYSERGAYTYVQLLNFSMPAVEVVSYDKGDYLENNLSVKKVIFEAIGLSNINTYGIVGAEISLFKNNLNTDIASLIKSVPGINKFNLKEGSIAKVTPEELAELNKVSAAYNPALKKNLDNTKPQILLYHTHTTEYYAEAKKDTIDNNFNVVGVGEVLAKELEEGYGISVIHDKTNHSIVYDDSYARSRETMKSYLEKYGDFDLVIDLHRDGSASNKLSTVNINNQDLAKIMFVMGKNSERFEENKKRVDGMYEIANSLFPGLIKPTYFWDPGACGVNQGYSDGSVLIEVGDNINTAQQAKLSAKYIARMIAEYLNSEEGRS